MATIRKRNNKYQVQVRIRGQYASNKFLNRNNPSVSLQIFETNRFLALAGQTANATKRIINEK